MFKGIVAIPVFSAMLVFSLLGKTPAGTDARIKPEVAAPSESMNFEMIRNGSRLDLRVWKDDKIIDQYNSQTHAVVVLQKFEGGKKNIAFMERKTMTVQESTFVILPDAYRELCEYFDIFHVWPNWPD